MTGNQCGCGRNDLPRSPRRATASPGENRLPLAMAYVPFQVFGETFRPEEALRKGTLFPCLYRPYREGSR